MFCSGFKRVLLLKRVSEDHHLTQAATNKSVESNGGGIRFDWRQAIARMGPGFAYVLTVLGTGDLVANSAAGAGYGYALIWILAPGLVFRFVWVNVSAKYVLVTGESLIEGYARIGQWVLWLILISLIVLMHLYNMYALVMSGNAVNMLLPLPSEWSAQIWSLFFCLCWHSPWPTGVATGCSSFSAKYSSVSWGSPWWW